MKIAVTGKGGVGKTTITALLVHAFREEGFSILAIDADPDANLASALGFSNPERIIPLVEMKDLIRERVGANSTSVGGLLKLNPKVDDLPEKLCNIHEGIRLMVMGTVKKGGEGCVCPESLFLRALIDHIFLKRDEVIIMDMEAGIEHLGRGTARSVDLLIIVVEPGKRSIETAYKIKELALHLNQKHLGVILNKVRNENERRFLEDNLNNFKILGFLPFSEEIIDGYQKDLVPWKASPLLYFEIKKITLALLRDKTFIARTP